MKKGHNPKEGSQPLHHAQCTAIPETLDVSAGGLLYPLVQFSEHRLSVVWATGMATDPTPEDYSLYIGVAWMRLGLSLELLSSAPLPPMENPTRFDVAKMLAIQSLRQVAAVGGADVVTDLLGRITLHRDQFHGLLILLGMVLHRFNGEWPNRFIFPIDELIDAIVDSLPELWDSAMETL